MSRTRRQHRILDLLQEHDVQSQDQLLQLLDDQGLGVTQATLSRDLKALGVVKEPRPSGGWRYRQVADDHLPLDIGRQNMRAFVTDIQSSGNLVVVRTRVGGAQPVALAIDGFSAARQLDGVLGTVAGDDTILVVAAEGVAARSVVAQLWSLAGQGDGADHKNLSAAG